MKVSLRPVAPDDVDLIHRWRNDPGVRAQMFHPDLITISEHQAYWKKRLADPRSISYVILEEKTPCGMIKLDLVDGEQDVGILIAPQAQGRGIATQALAALVPLAKRANIRKLTARIKEGNEASRSLFVHSGYVKKGDRYELMIS